MKLLKIEKDFCPACNKVTAFLEDSGVTYETLNIQGDDQEKADLAREYLGELQLFTVPVTVLVNEDGGVIEHVRGMDPEGLQGLVNSVK